MNSKLTFVGTGEAFDPELPNTSLLLEGDVRLLVDCGYSVPHAFWKISKDPELLTAVYISHIHADHSFGLPALLLWMRLAGRTQPLEVISGPGVESWLDRILNLGYPGSYEPSRCFPILPVCLAPGDAHQLGEWKLSCAASEHSVRNLALRVDMGSAIVCYSGDGRPTAETRALYAGATHLVHECYSSEPDVPNHASADEIVGMACDLAIDQLFLLHVGADRKERVRAGVDATRLSVTFPRPQDSVSLRI
jgi:ribonuclease BN (tRNA processing enzyme)